MYSFHDISFPVQILIASDAKGVNGDIITVTIFLFIFNL